MLLTHEQEEALSWVLTITYGIYTLLTKFSQHSFKTSIIICILKIKNLKKKTEAQEF